MAATQWDIVVYIVKKRKDKKEILLRNIKVGIIFQTIMKTTKLFCIRWYVLSNDKLKKNIFEMSKLTIYSNNYIINKTCGANVGMYFQKTWVEKKK